ncbi:MAG: hypothetical protein WB696_02230 [Chthoniobacterales bacterium]|jgi:hypothetical protein
MPNVRAAFETSQLASAAMLTEPLNDQHITEPKPKMYTVILTAKVNGKKVETRWDFTVDPARSVAP